MERHYGLDWLRIGAFGVLILYHVGMVFVPWDFHLKIAAPAWTSVPMLAVNPWRLSLLFLVSGYASRALLGRSDGVGAFARGRSARLLWPLLFGMLVIVPPQPWVELVSKHGYLSGFATFWWSDYFRFGRLDGVDLPTWNHLWFVVYLWVYTMLLAGLVAVVPASLRQSARRWFERVSAGPALVAIPIAYMILVNFVLFPGARETHALIGDWVAHATYLPVFLFGVALAGAPRVLETFRNSRRLALSIALAGYTVVGGIDLAWELGRLPPGELGGLFAVARAFQGWAAIVALVGYADRYWNRDAPMRAALTEAVFPFYIIHQTILLLVAFWLIPLGLPWPAAFAILVAATAAGCVLFYFGGRAIGPLRPFIGLRARRPAPPLSPAAA